MSDHTYEHSKRIYLLILLVSAGSIFTFIISLILYLIIRSKKSLINLVFGVLNGWFFVITVHLSMVWILRTFNSENIFTRVIPLVAAGFHGFHWAESLLRIYLKFRDERSDQRQLDTDRESSSNQLNHEVRHCPAEHGEEKEEYYWHKFVIFVSLILNPTFIFQLQIDGKPYHDSGQLGVDDFLFNQVLYNFLPLLHSFLLLSPHGENPKLTLKVAIVSLLLRSTILTYVFEKEMLHNDLGLPIIRMMSVMLYYIMTNSVIRKLNKSVEEGTIPTQQVYLALGSQFFGLVTAFWYLHSK